MWQQLIVWVVTTVLSALLAPRPRVEHATPAQITEKDIPMARQGAPIPVLFGTRVISRHNVVWWGDVRVSPITRSGGGGKK